MSTSTIGPNHSLWTIAATIVGESLETTGALSGLVGWVTPFAIVHQAGLVGLEAGHGKPEGPLRECPKLRISSEHVNFGQIDGLDLSQCGKS